MKTLNGSWMAPQIVTVTAIIMQQDCSRRFCILRSKIRNATSDSTFLPLGVRFGDVSTGRNLRSIFVDFGEITEVAGNIRHLEAGTTIKSKSTKFL